MQSLWWSPRSLPKRRCRRQCGAWRIWAAPKKRQRRPQMLARRCQRLR